ncbi:MAG: hypothetical protein ACFFEN_09710 [Candidatus Thorarchaeota archaeon]
MNEDQKRKIHKILTKVTFCALSTCCNGEPQTTLVQPSITTENSIIILSKNTNANKY